MEYFIIAIIAIAGVSSQMILSSPRSMLVSLAEEKMLRRLRQLANQSDTHPGIEVVVLRLVALEVIGSTVVVQPRRVELIDSHQDSTV